MLSSHDDDIFLEAEMAGELFLEQTDCSKLPASRPRCIFESSEEIASSGWTAGRNTPSVVRNEAALKGGRVADILPVLWGFFEKDSMIEPGNYNAVRLLYAHVKLVEMIIKLSVDVCHYILLT